MLFKKGKTKLTGLISPNEKYAQNSAIWTPVDDPKVAWCRMVISSAGVQFVSGDGIISTITREASAVATVSYVSAFDALPAVFVRVVCSGSAIDDRRFAMWEDGTTYTRSTTAQTIYVLDDTAAALVDDSAESIYVDFMAVGVDAGTTIMVDNSNTSPIDEQLNRMIAIGNYRNPDSLGDTVPVLSCGYTTNGGNPGDTLVNISNMTNHSRDGAGEYSTDFSTDYSYTPYAIVISCGGDAGTPVGAYGIANATTETLSVKTTAGTDNVAADALYSFLVLGMMEVS